MSENEVSERYVKDRDLLRILNESLKKGSLEMRREALWCLGNLAVSRTCSDLIILYQDNILDRVLDEMMKSKRKDPSTQ